MNPTESIAIIGGGVLSLFLLKAFIEEGSTDTSLTIFETSSHMGMGMPYSPDWANPEHMVNIACEEIPEIIEEPHIWLSRQSDEFFRLHGIERKAITPLLLLPRIVMGIYLEEQFYELVSLAEQRGFQISIRTNTRVCDVSYNQEENSVTLELENRSSEIFTRVIIATGHFWPTNREGRTEGYYDSPFPLNKLQGTYNHPVGILGTSLTAIDAIRTLSITHGEFMRDENGHLRYVLNSAFPNFRLDMYSRRGLLPSIRFHFEFPRLQKYLYVSREEILENIRQNDGFLSLDFVFERSYKDTIARDDPELYEIIRDMSIEEFVNYYHSRMGSETPFPHFTQQLELSRESERTGVPIFWKEVLDDTFYTLNFHAKSLSAEDMIRLRKYLMPLSYHDGAFVSFETCEELLALHEAGVLRLIKTGNHCEVITEQRESGATVCYQNEDEAVRTTYEKFIDCRGQRQLPFSAFPFPSLVEQGVISPARVVFRNQENTADVTHIPSGCSLETVNNILMLRLPGVAFTDSFQAVSMDGSVNDHVYVIAVAYIKGMNPDFSGIPFSNHAAQLLMQAIFTDVASPA